MEGVDSQEDFPIGIRFVTKTEKEITPEDIEGINQLADQAVLDLEAQGNQGLPAGDEEVLSATTHDFAFKALKRRKPDDVYSVVFAYDKEKLIGYSIIPVEKETNKIETTFLGVARPYQRKGIATKLLKEHHKTLLEMGINSYQTTAREEVVELYKKIGARVTQLKVPKILFTEGLKVRVDLA